jgi:uncharacterized protein (TIGR02453 family)
VSAVRYFTPETFDFLAELADNNDRGWFDANRDRFEEHVRDRALAFIEDFAEPLTGISPHLVANPSKVGGSLFRIHRDVRFSRDKTPYKTHVGIHVRHAAARDVHAPALYLHVEPGGSYAAAGLWRPSTADAVLIRRAIADDPDGWEAAAYDGGFAGPFHHGEERLVRMPSGFDPGHRFAADIRRKDFTAWTPLSRRRVMAPSFLDDYAALGRSAAPFMRFLCRALRLDF